MSRNQQDQFIDDDEEETCPLCVEEFDLGDRGFKPCPCGYQICQFCYNSIKNNMNGLCPACRRPYNEKDIEYKIITPEEQAAYKARQAQKQKKTQAALQKEKQKAEADNLSRKHLAGLRVVQKNLVYVTGLSPTSQEDQLLQTLRGDQYFGQYGKIIKIVVSKAKDPSHPHSVGVYVTYERKEDASSCIAAVDGSKNGDRTLRAQFGTTKYCSAYLRGETCTNRSCMFLHEPGEANDSYSRADLSALNAGSTQHGHGRPPPPQSQQPVASATPSQPMAPHESDQAPSPPPADRPALPSTASWASRPPQPSRAESRATSGTVESPASMHVTPASGPEASLPTEEQAPVNVEAVAEPQVSLSTRAKSKSHRATRHRTDSPLLALLENFDVQAFRLTFALDALPQADRETIDNYPPLFDQTGGAKRRLRRQQEEEQRRSEQEAQALQHPASAESDDNPEMSGSLQLGGEPEERHSLGPAQSAIQPPVTGDVLDRRFQLEGLASPGTTSRDLTSQQQQQQQQQLLLQSMKTPSDAGSYLDNLGQHGSLQQPSNPLGHQRNASRYSFANDTSASTAVKPVANPKLLSQQSSIMPSTRSNSFGVQHQPHASQFFTSNVQGPPPGLKTTVTPPVSGGMTFGQGHGFATGGLQYGANTSRRNQNEEMYRSLLSRDTSTGVADTAAKPDDADFPPLSTPTRTAGHRPPTRQQSLTLSDADRSRRSTPPVPPGFEVHAAIGSGRSTPTVPPGLAKLPKTVTDLEGGGSRPGSRASLRRQASGILPAVPLRPVTPLVAGKQTDAEEEVVNQAKTPTRALRENAAARLSVEITGGDDAKSSYGVAGVSRQVAKAVTTAEKQVNYQDSDAKTPSTALAPATNIAAPKAQASGEPGAANIMSAATATTSTKRDTSKADTQKKKHPGKIDIPVATARQEQVEPPKASTDTVKIASQSSDLTTIAPSKPQSPKVASPAAKSAPRTLRVISTPRAEAPPAPASKETLQTAATQQLSRKPSVASISFPGTPTSERVSMSDTISITSTSQSRANSPPPATTKVGSAPVRHKTKSQQKKERQERAKALEEAKAREEEIGVSNNADDSTTSIKIADDLLAQQQEAIVSRKKKAKKEKEPKAKQPRPTSTTAESTPTASRPATPVTSIPAPKVEQATKLAAQASNSSTPASTATFHAAPPSPSPGSYEPSPPPTPTLTAAQLLAELKATAPDLQRCIDSLFRSPASNHFKASQPITVMDLANCFVGSNLKYDFSETQVDALLKGTLPALQVGGTGGRLWDREMVTPTGAHLRALTQELETRFLELENAIRDRPDALRFHPSKPQNEMKFPTIELEALRRQKENSTSGRGVSVMEQMVQDGSSMKKGAFLVDEASKYINEFIMPPATPPPSAHGKPPVAGQQDGSGGGGATMGKEATGVVTSTTPTVVLSVDIAERQLNEARRMADERDAALKKIMKKNRKLFGLG